MKWEDGEICVFRRDRISHSFETFETLTQKSKFQIWRELSLAISLTIQNKAIAKSGEGPYIEHFEFYLSAKNSDQIFDILGPL